MAYAGQRYLSGKAKPGWRERWGHLPEALVWRPGARPRVWVHAVSAGEVVAAVPILREIRARLPKHDILFSIITPAGQEIATQQAAKYVDAIFYCPFDLLWVVRRAVRALHPQVFVSLESELWPNLLQELKRQGVATVMVNGRITEKSYRRIQRSGMGSGLFRWMLSNVDKLLMQSETHAERVRTLSGFSDTKRIQVIGNSKFDQEIARLSPEQVLALRSSLHFPVEAPIFVAGSTRSVEEEAEVIAAYKTMQSQIPELCLLIAPRHIQRSEEVVVAMQAAGLNPVRKTELPNDTVRHLVLDTLGELANVYALATITYVGNTLPPVVNGGGQNLLQPLAHGKPVFFGPCIATIRSEVAMAIEVGVGFQITDSASLAIEGLRLLSNPTLLQEIENRALHLIATNQGASARYAEVVAEMAQKR